MNLTWKLGVKITLCHSVSVRIRLYYAHKDSEIGLTYWRCFTNITYYDAIFYAWLIPEIQTTHQLSQLYVRRWKKKKKTCTKVRSVFPSLLSLVHSCFLKILCKYCLFCVLASHRAGFLFKSPELSSITPLVTWHWNSLLIGLPLYWILTSFRTGSIIPLNKHFWVLIWPSQLPRIVPRTHRCSVNL